MSSRRHYSLFSVIAVAVISLGAGIGMGLGLGIDPPGRPRNHSIQEERSMKPSESAVEAISQEMSARRATPSDSSGPAVRATESADEETDALRAGLASEREVSARLRQRVEDLEAVARGESDEGPRDSEERLEFAKKMLEGVLGIESRETAPGEQVKLAGLLQELDSDTASYFIEQYRAAGTAEEEDDLRDAALMLALISGGGEVSDFLSDLLQDTAIPVDDRQDLINEIGQWGSWVSMSNIPLTDSLRGTIEWMQASAEPWERAGAATLLAGSSSADSILTLKDLLIHDPDERVKASAARSLALIGDWDTKQFLQSYYDGALARGYLEGKPRLSSSLRSALKMLNSRFPG